MNADNYSHLTTPELNQLIHKLSKQSRDRYAISERGMEELTICPEYVEVDEATGEVTVGHDPRFNARAPTSL